MGIFSEADHHPFVELDGDVVIEDAHGGSGSEPWRDEHGRREYVRATEPRSLYIRDEAA
ncbi:MAG TPA: hypothetical protein VK457_13840 [Chloroflexota bacterium]|nr:hypothetical protein [Chloroflexota bacterium]